MEDVFLSAGDVRQKATTFFTATFSMAKARLERPAHTFAFESARVLRVFL